MSEANWSSVHDRGSETQPAAEVLKLFDAAMFDLIIGDVDAKNLGLLRGQNSVIGLAPLYDLLSTVYNPKLSQALAMKIAKRRS